MRKTLASSKGFTIIEVLIVLAIAGLILLIVFLAVPALQRNSRNTQRKNDVSSVLAALSEYQNNHNGQLPTGCLGSSPTCFVKDVPMTMFDNNTNKVAFSNVAPVTPDLLTPRGADLLQITTGAKCSNSGDGSATTAGAGRRNIVVLFGLETAGGATNICQES